MQLINRLYLLLLISLLATSCGNSDNSARERPEIGIGVSNSEFSEALSGTDFRDKMGENYLMEGTLKGIIVNQGDDAHGRFFVIDVGDGSVMKVDVAPEVKINLNPDMIGMELFASGTAQIDTSRINEVITHDPDDVNKPQKNVSDSAQQKPQMRFVARKVAVR